MTRDTIRDTHVLPWFAGFCVLLVLLPLPFGGNRPWASDVFGVSVGILTLALAWELWRKPELWPVGAPWKRLGFSVGLLLLVAFWTWLQTQSWLPQAWHHPLWREVQDLPEAHKGAVSLAPQRFLESLTRFLGYLACFVLAFFGGRESSRARALLDWLAGAAVLYALYGLLMQATGWRLILWYPKWAYHEFVTSTFVSKNAYATYASLGLQVCLAWAWLHLKKVSKEHAAPQIEKRIWREGPILLAPVIVLGALLLTSSRAGILSGLVGCCALLFGLAVNRKWRWTVGGAMALIGVAVILGALVLSDTLLLDRLSLNRLAEDTSQRLDAYALTLQIVASNPWRGFGLGGFEDAFRIYRDPTVNLWFQHAHNDYLEAAVELGVPATLILGVAILIPVGCCVTGLIRRKRDGVFSALALGASVTVGLHALVDFSLQIPAITATWAALFGLGTAQSWSSRPER